ncbi:hypothetical protein JCM8547_006225 [Rhodosporidiobolus lusitaniae]
MARFSLFCFFTLFSLFLLDNGLVSYVLLLTLSFRALHRLKKCVDSADCHQRRALSPHQHHNNLAARSFNGGQGHQLHKRQGDAPGAAKQVGTANPAAADADLNNFRVELPSKSDGGGNIQGFNGGNRLLRERDVVLQERQQNAPGAVVKVGISNPEPGAADLNQFDEAAPSKSGGGGPTAFSKRFAHPAPLPEQLNMAPHHLATRSKGGGIIELF